MSPPYAARARRLIAPLLSIPCVAAAIVAGAWVTGGVISNDFRASMALTAVWFALSGAACLAIGLRSRRFRLPVLGAYAVTAALVGGSSVSPPFATASWTSASSRRPPRRRARLNASGPSAATSSSPVGRFRSHEHETSGTAKVVRLTDGRRFLTLTSFATSSGPDLRVRRVPGDTSNGGASGSIDLGALKSNRGDQQYELPRRAALARRTVVIWCRAFSAPFGSAPLRAV
jgi:hypothetical protein